MEKSFSPKDTASVANFCVLCSKCSNWHLIFLIELDNTAVSLCYLDLRRSGLHVERLGLAAAARSVQHLGDERLGEGGAVLRSHPGHSQEQGRQKAAEAPRGQHHRH